MLAGPKTSFIILPEKPQNSNSIRYARLNSFVRINERIKLPAPLTHAGSKFHHPRRDPLPETHIMFHNEHGRLKSQD